MDYFAVGKRIVIVLFDHITLTGVSDNVSEFVFLIKILEKYLVIFCSAALLYDILLCEKRMLCFYILGHYLLNTFFVTNLQI